MSKKRKSIKKFNKQLLPIMAIPFVSIIMYGNYVEYSENALALNIAEGFGYVDIFAFWKMIVMSAIAIFMLLNIFFRYEQFTIKREKPLFKLYIPMGIYAFLIIISSIFSQYKEFAFIGMYERYEGMFALLSYLIFVYYISQVVKDEFDLKFVFYSLIAGTGIVIIIGVLQGFGTDVLTSDFAQKLIGLADAQNVERTFREGWAYSTLYNPNYLGQYTAILLPTLLGLFHYFKSLKMKILMGVLTVFNIMAMYFSNTSSAYLAVAVCVAFFILFNIKLIWENIVTRIVFLTAVVGVIALTTAIFTGMLGEEIVDKIDNATSVNLINEDRLYIEEINVEKERVEFVTNKYTLYMHVLNGDSEGKYSIYFSDGNKNAISTELKGYTIYFEEEPYKDLFTVTLYKEGYIDVGIKSIYGRGQIRYLYTYENGFEGIVSAGQQVLTELKPSNMPESLIGYEQLFSRRLYMWAVSFVNLKDNILIGDGPDTFRADFDQTDLIGKINTFHHTTIIVDKPHNIYLMIAQGTGVVSLIAFLALLVMYILWSFKLYINIDYKNKLKIFGVCNTLSVISYMASGIFIDSNVSVSPLFFMLLGLGIAINYMVHKKA